jgi:hypothetical protein
MVWLNFTTTVESYDERQPCFPICEAHQEKVAAQEEPLLFVFVLLFLLKEKERHCHWLSTTTVCLLQLIYHILLFKNTTSITLAFNRTPNWFRIKAAITPTLSQRLRVVLLVLPVTLRSTLQELPFTSNHQPHLSSRHHPRQFTATRTAELQTTTTAPQ